MSDNLAGVVLIALGLLGVYGHVEYAGWAIFIGGMVIGISEGQP